MSESIIETQLDALLRWPQRTGKITELVFTLSTTTSSWTETLLAKFTELWPLLSSLKDLLMMSEWTDHISPNHNYGPIIRSLSIHGTMLRLHSFKCDSWMAPFSNVLRLLSSQPSITCLVGPNVSPLATPNIDHDFLPSLEKLVCHNWDTAVLLLSGRPIRSLKISYLTLYELLESRIEQTSRDMIELSISIWTPDGTNIGSLPDILALRFPMLRSLTLFHTGVDEEGARQLASFTHLEEVCCWNDSGYTSSEQIARWAAPVRSLRKIVFYDYDGEVTRWVRNFTK